MNQIIFFRRVCLSDISKYDKKTFLYDQEQISTTKLKEAVSGKILHKANKQKSGSRDFIIAKLESKNTKIIVSAKQACLINCWRGYRLKTIIANTNGFIDFSDIRVEVKTDSNFGYGESTMV